MSIRTHAQCAVTSHARTRQCGADGATTATRFPRRRSNFGSKHHSGARGRRASPACAGESAAAVTQPLLSARPAPADDISSRRVPTGLNLVRFRDLRSYL
ncbi:hypothetical protein EVAR_46487_1 [Eumeta japonica]|uniref:Uncharacterized protein n=1 Tax=Eumeta variegata TaxID=151549 RepID=A0A4C1WU24_EUMVA|nr:hypothetical protein EVAR_46487_1 [Eumeta japonica]